jgi:hypothetical protein
MNRTADLTGFTRQQIVRAMSNERRRLKAERSTTAEPQIIMEDGKDATQLKELRESLQVWIDKGCFPTGRDAEVEELV